MPAKIRTQARGRTKGSSSPKMKMYSYTTNPKGGASRIEPAAPGYGKNKIGKSAEKGTGYGPRTRKRK